MDNMTESIANPQELQSSIKVESPKRANQRNTPSTTSPKKIGKSQQVIDQNLEVQQIVDKIEDLIVLQKEYERTRKYLDAQNCKKQVKALKDSIGKREQFGIKARHRSELKELDQARDAELAEFNTTWDQLIAQINSNAQLMKTQLTKRHQNQINELIEAERQSKHFESAELLNLRRIQQELAKQEKYLEAHSVQQQCVKLEREELQKFKKTQEKSGKYELASIRQRQQSELAALDQRHSKTLSEKLLQRATEQAILKLKYANLAQELENKQTMELAKFQKGVKLAKLEKKSLISSVASLSKLNI